MQSWFFKKIEAAYRNRVDLPSSKLKLESNQLKANKTRTRIATWPEITRDESKLLSPNSTKQQQNGKVRGRGRFPCQIRLDTTENASKASVFPSRRYSQQPNGKNTRKKASLLAK
jgi:hypothetical protein